jgi:hypothetical protein
MTILPTILRAQSWARQHLADLLIVSGGVTVSTGVGMIYLPAGVIVAGVLAIVAGVVGARGEARA